MKKGKKKGKIIIGILVIAIILGITAMSSKTTTQYRTYVVQKGNIENMVTGSGTISAGKSRKEYAKVSAEITDVFLKEGDQVKTGDVIMRLDSQNYESGIEPVVLPSRKTQGVLPFARLPAAIGIFSL